MVHLQEKQLSQIITRSIVSKLQSSDTPKPVSWHERVLYEYTAESGYNTVQFIPTLHSVL